MPRDEVVLSLDAAQCGLGNSSCGPGVLEKYAVLPGQFEQTIILAPMEAEADPGILAKRLVESTYVESGQSD